MTYIHQLLTEINKTYSKIKLDNVIKKIIPNYKYYTIVYSTKKYKTIDIFLDLNNNKIRLLLNKNKIEKGIVIFYYNVNNKSYSFNNLNLQESLDLYSELKNNNQNLDALIPKIYKVKLQHNKVSYILYTIKNIIKTSYNNDKKSQITSLLNKINE